LSLGEGIGGEPVCRILQGLPLRRLCLGLGCCGRLFEFLPVLIVLDRLPELAEADSTFSETFPGGAILPVRRCLLGLFTQGLRPRPRRGEGGAAAGWAPPHFFHRRAGRLCGPAVLLPGGRRLLAGQNEQLTRPGESACRLVPVFFRELS